MKRRSDLRRLALTGIVLGSLLVPASSFADLEGRKAQFKDGRWTQKAGVESDSDRYSNSSRGDMSDRGDWVDNAEGPGGPAEAVPELDPGAVAGSLILLIGGTLVLAERRRTKRSQAPGEQRG